MNLTVLMILMVVALILAIAWSVVDWAKVLRNAFANRPYKGRIYVESEEDLIPINGKRISVSKRGEIFEYKWAGQKKTVIVGPNYPVKYVEGRRVIAIRDGRLVASKLHGQPSKEMETDAVAAIVQSHIIVDLVNALTSKGMPKWLLIVLLIAGAALAFFVIQQMGGGAETVPPTQPPINPETGEPFASLLTMWGV